MTFNRPYIYVYLFSKGIYYADTYVHMYLHQNKFVPSGVVESGRRNCAGGFFKYLEGMYIAYVYIKYRTGIYIAYA